MNGEPRLNTVGSWELDTSGGWLVYRQAVDLLSRAEQPPALRLLAEAETVFRASEDQHGLWRALAGQSATHWQVGDGTLALARASAALRVATTAGDHCGVGVVAWQIGVLQLQQAEYQQAACSLFQVQESLPAGQEAVTSESLAACVQLCREIERWQELYARQLVAWRTAAQVIEAVQHDLAGHLWQTAARLRKLWRESGPIDDIEYLLLQPSSSGGPPLARHASTRPSLWHCLHRWWQRLSGSDQPLVAVPSDSWLAVATPRTPPPARVDPLTEEPAHAAEEPPTVPHAPAPPAAHGARLAVSCFGHFRVALDDQQIERWESVRGRTIFKYLVSRRGVPVPKELLADMFWPESEPELARRSLHQAIYCLRQSFKRVDPSLTIVHFNGDCYQINQELSMWVDSEEFSSLIAQARTLAAAGQEAEAMQRYAVAADLASGEFLEEDRYESWAEELRQSYRVMATEALRQLSSYHFEHGDFALAILFSQRLLTQESCDEEAHLTLMRCHSAQGLRHLAVRQYQICTLALKTELGLAPSDEIEDFYQQVVALA